jgi:hypothetical protein
MVILCKIFAMFLGVLYLLSIRRSNSTHDTYSTFKLRRVAHLSFALSPFATSQHIPSLLRFASAFPLLPSSLLGSDTFGILTSSLAGSFNIYTTRFFSPAYGFALTWNYWLNAAVSVASDLTAVQLVLEFWKTPNPWIFSLALWIFLISVNAFHVKAYGELGTYTSTVFLAHAYSLWPPKQSIGWLHSKLQRS